MLLLCYTFSDDVNYFYNLLNKPMKSERKLYLIAQNIRSLFNVGSLFRAADIFAVDKIYLCGYTATPPHQEISKTALGAQDWIPWEKHLAAHVLIKKLKQQGVSIIALETERNSTTLPKFKPQFPMAIIVGNEVTGITEGVLNLADEIISIPMLGKKESLNVAVAASIALYEIRRKQ